MWGRTQRGATIGSRRFERERTFGHVRATLRGPESHTVVELAGEFDFATPSSLTRYLLETERMIVGIDISNIEFIDGDGVRRLVSLAQQLGNRADMDEPVTITGTTPEIERAFNLVERQSLTLV